MLQSPRITIDAKSSKARITLSLRFSNSLGMGTTRQR
jgi:hypothetical protein